MLLIMPAKESSVPEIQGLYLTVPPSPPLLINRHYTVTGIVISSMRFGKLTYLMTFASLTCCWFLVGKSGEGRFFLFTRSVGAEHCPVPVPPVLSKPRATPRLPRSQRTRLTR